MMEFVEFVNKHTERIKPLKREKALMHWEAALTGNEESAGRFGELELKIREIYSNRYDYDYLKGIVEDGSLTDPISQRMAHLLYLKYRKNQLNRDLLNRMVELGTRVKHRFNIFRPVMDGGEITTNQIYQILKVERDNETRREAWEASKRVGEVVEPELLELIELRNRAARSLGYDNYFFMSLKLNEQDPDHLTALYRRLDQLTREPFIIMKKGLDEQLSGRYGIPAEELLPWHYHDPYFQEAPFTGRIDLDRYYQDRDVVEMAGMFYRSVGMPVDEVIPGSDLYEREGKNPHAFCTDIDREGDIRVLANVKNNAYWMETMLHELGHAVYDRYIDPSIPYLIRQYPHLCLTEAVAIFFGRCCQLGDWMTEALGLPQQEADELAPRMEGYLRTKELIFARWCQTMFNFEQELYRNPAQDLNRLWWDLVEEYQMVNRPPRRSSPDWAAKIHMVSNPVYYHNYMLGELIASQFYNYLKQELSRNGEFSIYGNKMVGEFFINKIFKPGNRVPWERFVEQVTGEPLNPNYFVNQFAEEKS